MKQEVLLHGHNLSKEESVRDKAMLQKTFLYDVRATSFSEEMLMKKQGQGTEGMKDLSELVSAARLSDEKGDYRERDRLCDEGLRTMTMLLASGSQFHDTAAAFGTSASVYDRMADLHEIKGEEGMAKVYRSQAEEIRERLTAYTHSVRSITSGMKGGSEGKAAKELLAEKIRRD